MQQKMEMDPKIMKHKVNDDESHSKWITTTSEPSTTEIDKLKSFFEVFVFLSITKLQKLFLC